MSQLRIQVKCLDIRLALDLESHIRCPLALVGHVHSPCGKEHYEHNHFKLLTTAILEICKSTGCLEPKKRVDQEGTALDSATKSRWWNACQLILLRPCLGLHGELEDMSSAPIMQWDYWTAHSWNVEWCPTIDLLQSQDCNPAEEPQNQEKGEMGKSSLQSKRTQPDAKSRGFRAGNILASESWARKSKLK